MVMTPTQSQAIAALLNADRIAGEPASHDPDVIAMREDVRRRVNQPGDPWAALTLAQRRAAMREWRVRFE